MKLNRYTATCTQKQCIAKEVYELRFTKPKGFLFEPGQFVMWDVPLIDDPDDVQSRAYSLASSPQEDDLLFVLKYKEGGRASEWVKQIVEPEMEMTFQGPIGVFTFNPDPAKHTIFVCTGTGNAPFRGMITHALEGGFPGQIDLLQGNYDEEYLFWEDEFSALEEAYPQFHNHITFTSPTPDWKGRTGYVQEHLPDLMGDGKNTSVFICGNPAMTEEVKRLCIEQWDIPKENMNVEEYL